MVVETDAGLDTRLAERFGLLSPAEQRVARFFADRRTEVAFLSAVEIAQQLETSDATVVRTAQALGYSGLADLKRELGAALRMRGNVSAQLGRRLEEIGDEPEAALDSVLAWQIGLLEDARRTVRPDAFARAVSLLRHAQRIYVFGIGPGASVAEYAALKLTRFGRQAGTLTNSGVRLADQLVALRTGDALVVQAYGTVYREVDVTLDRARDVGAPVVLVTDTLAGQLAGRYDVALEAQRSRSGELGSVAVALVLLDALLLGLAGRDKERSLAAGDLLSEMRKRLMMT